ncbi:MAG: Glutamine--fructose-6-phosphate aminotransferase (isomerizing) [Parcubacteria group bacterium ADurb.Bin247]|nr:MAG: Glutamine--fructose-6-phosphate aminotransferase (isomerizing) [Parcubacteria group bacterium ADurb.Bin247]
MCGIIGYIGDNGALDIGMKGLKRLEYRGYDSAGLAISNGKEVSCIKVVGKVEELEKIVGDKDLVGSSIILHSRWATHGGITESNAHPHADCKGNIFVVHNGIIENYKQIREKLKLMGHKFVSETDTEVLPHLIEHFYNGNLEEAVIKALKYIKGTYGLVVMAKHNSDRIVVARMFSPLVISVNEHGGFVASDPSAIISHSKRMIFLEDGEVAVIKKDDFIITDLERKVKDKKETELDWDIEEAQKSGYAHFMLKEIMEQSESVANSMRGRLIIEEGISKLGGIDSVKDKLKDIKKINILACGTSYYAGLIGEYLLEELAGIPTEVDFASEFRYRKFPTVENEAYLFISQSGETADSLAALKEVKKRKALSLGIVNVVGSSIARETDAGVYNHAGPEIGVASTKAFTSQVVVLALVALFLGRQRNLSLADGKTIAKEISKLPELINNTLKDISAIELLAKKYNSASNFLFIGRKYSYPVAMEGALKLKEISYIHSEGYSAGEMKHGPIALIEENFPTIAICPQDSVYEKTVSNIQEIKARNGKVIAITTQGNEEIKSLVDDIIYIPKVNEVLSPILSVIPVQIFAYYMAVSFGHNPDMPRNLAKSVTVE